MPSLSQRFIGAGLIAMLAIVSAGAFQPAIAADPFEIPVILPLTGGGAFLGKSQNLSLQLIEQMVNKEGGIKGRPIHFSVQDDQSNPQVAVQLTNGVLAKKPPVIMGSSIVAMCNAMAALVKASGPVQYCFRRASIRRRTAIRFHRASARTISPSRRCAICMASTSIASVSSRRPMRVGKTRNTRSSRRRSAVRMPASRSLSRSISTRPT